jgi:hypothetical protein
MVVVSARGVPMVETEELDSHKKSRLITMNEAASGNLSSSKPT